MTVALTVFNIKRTGIALAGLMLLSCTEEEKVRHAVSTSAAPPPIGPYSQAIRSRARVYVSGQIAVRSDGTLDTSSVTNECRQVMENIKAVLGAEGYGMERICKTTIYTTNLGWFGDINKVYGSYFSKDPPARETVQVSALPKGARIEISVIAE